MSVYIEKSGDLVGCHYSGTDDRTKKDRATQQMDQGLLIWAILHVFIVLSFWTGFNPICPRGRGAHYILSLLLPFFAQKKLIRNTRIFWVESLQTGSSASPTNQKFQKSNIIWRVPGIQSLWILLNMVNHSRTSHFKRIGTLTPPNTKTFRGRGAQCARPAPLAPGYAQMDWGK